MHCIDVENSNDCFIIRLNNVNYRNRQLKYSEIIPGRPRFEAHGGEYNVILFVVCWISTNQKSRTVSVV